MLTDFSPNAGAGLLFNSVFVSATFTDLRLEREEVLRFLQKRRCIPLGMETFTPGYQPPWDVITQAIDLSDYYVLIIKNRYGSRLPQPWADQLGNISYTEAEYNYATAHGIPTMVFVHSNPDAVPVGESSESQEDREALRDFRARATENVTRGEFTEPVELGREIATAWPDFVEKNPARGWTRGPIAAAASSGGSLTSGRRASSRGLDLDAIRSRMAAQVKAPKSGVEIVLGRWARLATTTVDLRCELEVHTLQISSTTGTEISSADSLSTIVPVLWSDVLEGVMMHLQRGRLRGAALVVPGVAFTIWVDHTTLLPSDFRGSMAAAERDVRRRAANEWSESVRPTEDDLNSVEVGWTLSLDLASAEKVCIGLKRIGLLNEDSGIWYLSNAGVELYEQRFLPSEHPGQSTENNDG